MPLRFDTIVGSWTLGLKKCLLSLTVGPRGMEDASGTDAVTPRAAAPTIHTEAIAVCTNGTS